MTPRNPWPGALLGIALSLLLNATPLSSRSVADVPRPGAPPSAGAVLAAQDAVAQRAAQVADIEAQLERAQGAVQALDIEVGLAVERYNGARVRQQQAQQQSSRAAALALQADAASAAARRSASELAAEQYRMGVPAGLSAVQNLLTARNLHGAGLQQQALRWVSERTRTVVDQAAATAAAAATASTAADQAVGESTRATAAVKQAADEVRGRLDDQRAQLALIDTQRTALLARLAAAQQISVSLAAQRQQALAAAAAAAAAQAARQAAIAAAARQSAAAPTPASTHPADPAAAVSFARAQLGRPYVWGGAGPDTFDCSGLTMRAWERAGIALPHFAADQYAQSSPLTYSQLRPGDLVFWSHDGTPQDIYHVALYIGDDQMIEAPRTGDVVKTANLWIMGNPTYYARP